MTVLVESCWNGAAMGHSYRLTVPKVSIHLWVDGAAWNRRAVKDALDIVESYTGARRRNIRFNVK